MTLHFNWPWAGLMVLLLCVCLSGASIAYALLFSGWFCARLLVGSVSRRWIVALAAGSLLQLVVFLVVNGAAAWSAEVRAWVFEPSAANHSRGMGPRVVKGLLGVCDWRGVPASDPSLSAVTESEVDDTWQWRCIVSTVAPVVALLVYTVACSRWLSRGGTSARARAPLTPPTAPAEISEETNEAVPLLPTQRTQELEPLRASRRPLTPSTHRRRTGEAPCARWRRRLLMWSLTLLVLSAWQAWGLARSGISRPTPSHSLLFDLPLEAAALLSWCVWSLAGGYCLDTAHVVRGALYVAAVVLAVPAMTLAFLRNAYLREVITEAVEADRAKAWLGVAETLDWTAVYRIHGLFFLSLLGAALRASWQSQRSRPAPTVGRRSGRSGTGTTTHRSRRSSLSSRAATSEARLPRDDTVTPERVRPTARERGEEATTADTHTETTAPLSSGSRAQASFCDRHRVRARVSPLSWTWLLYAWVPIQTALLPSVASAVGAVAYAQVLWRTTAAAVANQTATHRHANCAHVARLLWHLTLVAFACALLAQTASLSLLPFLSSDVLDLVWTGTWWPPSAHTLWQPAQHAVLLVVFCGLSRAAPVVASDARRGVSAEGPVGTPLAASTREGSVGADAAIEPVAPAIEAEAVAALGESRYREVVAFARRVCAVSAAATTTAPTTHARPHEQSERATLLDQAFQAWFGRSSTSLERTYLLASPSTLSVESFVRERAMIASRLGRHWWGPFTVVPEAVREIIWRVAPSLFTVVLLAHAASMDVAHTSAISVSLVALALIGNATGWLNYGTATRHHAARALVALCAVDLYVSLLVGYGILWQAPHHTPAESVRGRVCDWLRFVGLWPLHASSEDWCLHWLVLVALQTVHDAGQRCGTLSSWHAVLDRIEWRRAVQSAHTSVWRGSTPQGALVACQRTTHICLLLACSAWLGARHTFKASTTTSLLWSTWGVVIITATTRCDRRLSALVRTSAVLVVVLLATAVAIAQLPMLQSRLATWLSASASSCAETVNPAGDSLSPPWRCLEQLGLYAFRTAPPPSSCPASAEWTRFARLAASATSADKEEEEVDWRLLPFLLPWFLLCATATSQSLRAAASDEGSSGDSALDGPPHGADVPLVRFTSTVAERVVVGVHDWLWCPLRRARYLLLWTSLALVSSAMDEAGALRLPYTLCLLTNAPPLAPAVYSVFHMVGVSAYQLPWVPTLTSTVTVPGWCRWWLWGPVPTDYPGKQPQHIALASLIGLHKAPATMSSLTMLWCPLCVLLASVPALVASYSPPKPSTAETTASSALDTDSSAADGGVTQTLYRWAHFLSSLTLVALFSHEAVILCLLLLLQQLQAHALGSVVLVCVVLTWRGRSNGVHATPGLSTRGVLWLTAALCIGAATVCLLRDSATPDVAGWRAMDSDSAAHAAVGTATETLDWRLWCSLASLCDPRTLMWTASALVMCLHLSTRASPIRSQIHCAHRAALDGCPSLLAHIRQHLPRAVSTAQHTIGELPTAGEPSPESSPASEMIDHVYLPALSAEAFACVVPVPERQLDPRTFSARLSRAVVCVVGYTAPFALLTFIAGAAGQPSLLHVVWMVAALLEVTYMEIIEWRAFRWWRPLSGAYLGLMVVMPVMVHVPAIVKVLHAHEGLFAVLGLLEHGTSHATAEVSSLSSRPLTVPTVLSGWCVATMFAVCVQERSLTDVWSASFLHRLYRSYGRRRARYEALQARIARRNDEQVAAVREYDAELRHRLALMREYDHRHEPLVAAPLQPMQTNSAAGALWPPDSASPRTPTAAALDQTHYFSDWLLRVIRRLAQHTYCPGKVEVDFALCTEGRVRVRFLLTRLLLALYRVAESHTVVLVVLVALINSLVTGSIFELCGLAYLLLVALTWYPHPPQRVFQSYSLYVTAGILLKAGASLLTARLDLPDSPLRVFSWTLLYVSHAATNSLSADLTTASVPSSHTGTVKYAHVIMDFLLFSALTVHHYASVWNGVYRAEVVRDEPTHSTDLPAGGSLAPTGELGHATDSPVDESAEEEEEDDELERSDTAVGEEDEEDGLWSSEQAFYAAAASSLHAHVDQLRDYWRRMTTTVAMGTDYYTVYTCLDALALAFMICAYTSMASSEYTSLQEKVRNNMVPGRLVLIIAASMLQLVVERVLYVRRAMRGKVVLTVGTTLLYCGIYCGWCHAGNHTIIASGVNGGGGGGGGHVRGLVVVSDRTWQAWALARLYFALKVGASAASARQLRKGFPRRRPHDCFTGHPESLTRYALHMTFRAVPFVWECRALIDWTVMHTSLSLDSFLKTEDVYETVYLRRVQLAGLLQRPRAAGSPVPRRTKVLVGLSRLVLVLTALLAPLLYYSTLNPAVHANAVTQLEVSLSFNGARPFYSSLVQSPDNGTTVPLPWRDYLARTRPSLSTYGGLLPANDVQRLEMAECSEELWLISPTALRKLEESLEQVANDTTAARAQHAPPLTSSTPAGATSRRSNLGSTHGRVFIAQTLQVSRGSADASGSSSSALSWSNRWELPSSTARDLLDVIRQNRSTEAAPRQSALSPSDEDGVHLTRAGELPSVHLPLLYTPFVFNRDASVSAYQPDELSRPYRNQLNCSLQLRVERDDTARSASSSVRYWCLTCEPLFTSGDFPMDNVTAFPEWPCLIDSPQGPSQAECLASFNFEDAARGTLRNDSYSLHQNRALWLPLRYIVMSPPVVVKLPFLSGLGIVALYTTFVLALGRLMRTWFSAKAKAVIQTDMANPAPVSQLLECIYTARECGELELEETAYLELIDLLRSPERLLAVTGHVQQLHQQLANMSVASPTTAAGDDVDTAAMAAKKKA